METFFVLLVLGIISQKGEGFMLGPPPGSCGHAYPHHGPIDPNTGLPIGPSSPLTMYLASENPNPYELTTDSGGTYYPGQSMRVTVRGNAQNRDKPFKGFIFRATRQAGPWDTDTLYGTFSDWMDGATGNSYNGFTLDCLHHSINITRTILTFTWTAPNYNVGPLLLTGTVLVNYEEFYLFVETLLTPMPEVPGTMLGRAELGFNYRPSTNINFDFSGCGKDYGCLKSPGDCGLSDCTVIVSWRPDPDDPQNIYFEMRSQNPTFDMGFFALGWSPDNLMGDEDTVTCSYDDEGRGNVQYGVNAGSTIFSLLRYQDRRPSEGFTKMRFKRDDGILYCSFSRPAKMDTFYWALTLDLINDPATRVEVQTDLMTQDYYLFVAYGASYSFDSPNKHGDVPRVSARKFNFATNKEYHAYAGETITNLDTTDSTEPPAVCDAGTRVELSVLMVVVVAFLCTVL